MCPNFLIISGGVSGILVATLIGALLLGAKAEQTYWWHDDWPEDLAAQVMKTCLRLGKILSVLSPLAILVLMAAISTCESYLP